MRGQTEPAQVRSVQLSGLRLQPLIETRRPGKKKTVRDGAGRGITPNSATLNIKAEFCRTGPPLAGFPHPTPQPTPSGERSARRARSGVRTPCQSLPGPTAVCLPTSTEWGRRPGTCRAILTSPICSSTSSSRSTVGPMLLLGTGQSKRTVPTPGEDAAEASEYEGERGGGGGCEETCTSSGSAMEKGRDDGIRT